jgi:hypothetical protein
MKQACYIGVAFFGMICGIPAFLHPVFLVAVSYSNNIMNPVFFDYGPLIVYFASLMASTAVVILAGIPAAIYERLTGVKGDSTNASLLIWFAGTVILAIPAIGPFLRIGL